MPAKQVVHYQTKLQTALCYGGRTENATFHLPHVTCGNCLERKRREQRDKGINWKDIQRNVEALLPRASRALKEFCLAHATRGHATLGNYPPRIIVCLYLLPRVDKRHKTIGHNIGTGAESNIVQAAVPTDDDLDSIASFIGELSEALGLCARREGNELVPLMYELRPDYKKIRSLEQKGENLC
jgi:hypothetical protein